MGMTYFGMAHRAIGFFRDRNPEPCPGVSERQRFEGHDVVTTELAKGDALLELRRWRVNIVDLRNGRRDITTWITRSDGKIEGIGPES